MHRRHCLIHLCNMSRMRKQRSNKPSVWVALPSELPQGLDGDRSLVPEAETTSQCWNQNVVMNGPFKGDPCVTVSHGRSPSGEQAPPAPCHDTCERELVNLPSSMLPSWQARLYDVYACVCLTGLGLRRRPGLLFCGGPPPLRCVVSQLPS